MRKFFFLLIGHSTLWMKAKWRFPCLFKKFIKKDNCRPTFTATSTSTILIYFFLSENFAKRADRNYDSTRDSSCSSPRGRESPCGLIIQKENDNSSNLQLRSETIIRLISLFSSLHKFPTAGGQPGSLAARQPGSQQPTANSQQPTANSQQQPAIPI